MSMSPTGSRPIAPAPSQASASAPSSSSPLSWRSSSTLSSDSPSSPLSNQSVGIRRASTACQTCKNIKRKCDQARPCSNCVKSNTACAYNEASDGRRKAARKRTVETLELKRDALDTILSSFRSSTDVHSQHLLSLIRANAPLEEIVEYAKTHASSLPENDLKAITIAVCDRPRKNVMSIFAMCDRPLQDVPALPWTTVTTDDGFVSHLISLFFNWYHVAYPTVEKSLFLRDMRAGELDCQFCSPLLVNAMLTLACHFSDHPRACHIPSDTATRGIHFFNEAVRLWNAEAGKPTLLNVQAMSVLAVATCLLGKDRLGLHYMELVNTMYQELALVHVRAERRGLPPPSQEMRLSESQTCWTVFIVSVGYVLALMRPSSIQTPVTRRPITFRPPQSVKWIPYPSQTNETNLPLDLLHDAYFDLHEIGLSIQAVLFSGRNGREKSDVDSLDRRLFNWRNNIHASLRIDDGSSSMIPPIMDLQKLMENSLTYHFFRITLFSFSKQPSPTSHGDAAKQLADSIEVSPPPISEPDSAWSSDTPLNIIQSPHLPFPSTAGTAKTPESTSSDSTTSVNTVVRDAQSQSRDSAKSIANLCRCYARTYGLKQPTMWMPQASASAAYAVIDSLADPEIQEIFHELCSVLIASSRRWLVMKGHVRMLLLTIEQKGHKLMPETLELLRMVGSKEWGDQDHQLFVSSAYPNYALAREAEDPMLNTMGDLLELWATMKVKAEEDESVDAAGGTEDQA